MISTRSAATALLAAAALVSQQPQTRPSRVQRSATYYVAQRNPTADDGNPGTPARPFKTISRGAKAVKPGDTVIVEDGVYREQVTIDASGTAEKPVLFTAAPMANVTVTGSEILTKWRREQGPDNIFSTAWPHEFIGWSKTHAHPDDDYHRMIGRAEQVHVDNYPLLQVLSRDRLSRGTFFVDLAEKRLYVWDRANQDVAKGACTVEASVREDLLTCKGSFVTVRGFRFRYAATPAQHGAVRLSGSHDTLEDCTIERVNGGGASFTGDDCTVRRCAFRENGQMAFGAQGRNFRMTGCIVENNNVKDWDRGWEAVDKLVLCRNAVIEKSVFRNNRGVGIWFDIGNENCTVRNCLITGNEDAGIFYEISYGLHALDNVIVGNGLAPRKGAWGANGGIALSSSPYCLVERNLLIANREGFQFREQERTTPRIGDRSGKEVAIWCHDETIRNNVIAYNQDVQTGGWLDVRDSSLWPRAMQAAKAGHAMPPHGPLSPDLDHLAKKPSGLSLEDLRLQMEGNLYATRPGQRLFQWGPTWQPHENYARLEDVRSALKLEQGSRQEPITFRDWITLDLRVARGSPLVKMGCYPQGGVPGVTLGTF